MNNKLVKCKKCGNEFNKKEKLCPNCGAKNSKPFYKKWWFYVLAVLAFFILIGALGGSDSDKNNDSGESRNELADGNGNSTGITGQNTPKPTETPKPTNTPKPTKTPKPTNTPKPTKTPTPTPTPAKTDYYVGETFNYNGQMVTLVSTEYYTSDNMFMQPAEGKRYIRFVIHVENQSKSDISVTTYDFSCYADGYKCDSHYESDDLSASLSAGRTADGALYYEVPENSKEIEVEYAYELFGSKVIKFIFEGNKDSGLEFEKNTAAHEDALHVGDSINNSGLLISYIGAAEHISNNMFMQPEEGYKYIYIEIEIENQSKSDKSISYFSFDCYADGVKCDGFYGRDDGISATISSGRKAKGTVAFKVPVDAETIEIELDKNILTDKKIYFLYE